MARTRYKRKRVTLNVTVHTASAETSRLTEEARATAAEAARNKQPKKRQARPNQLPPQRRRQQVPNDVLDNSSADPSSGDDEGSDVGSEGEEGEQQQPRRGGRGSWKERLHRQRDAADAQRPLLTAEMQLAATRLPASVSKREECSQVYMHDCIQRSLESHTCHQHADAELQHISARPVKYLTMGHAVSIEVPTVRCTFCCKQWEVSACAAHCFPSTPVLPYFWVDGQMLQFFSQCTFKGGLSGTAWAAAAAYVRELTGAEHVHFSAR